MFIALGRVRLLRSVETSSRRHSSCVVAKYEPQKSLLLLLLFANNAIHFRPAQHDVWAGASDSCARALRASGASVVLPSSDRQELYSSSPFPLCISTHRYDYVA